MGWSSVAVALATIVSVYKVVFKVVGGLLVVEDGFVFCRIFCKTSTTAKQVLACGYCEQTSTQVRCLSCKRSGMRERGHLKELRVLEFFELRKFRFAPV
jgi:hypothetical protein